MACSREEYWKGLPLPSPGEPPHPEVELVFPAMHADSLPTGPPGKLLYTYVCVCVCIYIYVYVYSHIVLFNPQQDFKVRYNYYHNFIDKISTQILFPQTDLHDYYK